MIFEYDAHKAQANLAKHGIDFEQVKRLWENKHVIFPARSQYENRYALIGELGGKIYTCIYTLRGERTRLISCRIARTGERSLYEKAVKSSK